MEVNITLAIDEKTLAAGRAYAERHQLTLNALIGDLLAKAVRSDRIATVEGMFRLMDDAPGQSGGRPWTREGLHARRAVR